MAFVVSNKSEFSELLERKYQEWRAVQTARKAGITQFAESLGLEREVLSSYMNRGSKPQGENLSKLVEKLGPEVYDSLGLLRPEMQKLVEVAGELPENNQEKVLQFALLLRSNGELGKEDKEVVLRAIEKIIKEEQGSGGEDS